MLQELVNKVKCKHLNIYDPEKGIKNRNKDKKIKGLW